MTPIQTAAWDRYLKHKALLEIEWDGNMVTECYRVYPDNVPSDFETQIKQEIQAWIKKQPAHKCWATPADSAREFWKERLN